MLLKATLLLFFYTDVAKINAAIVGTIMLVSRILDGFVDIGVGAIVDNTKSTKGKQDLGFYECEVNKGAITVRESWFWRICI